MKKIICLLGAIILLSCQEKANESVVKCELQTMNTIKKCHDDFAKNYPHQNTNSNKSYAIFLKEYYDYFLKTNNCLIEKITSIIPNNVNQQTFSRQLYVLYDNLFKLQEIIYTNNQLVCRDHCGMGDAIKAPINVENILGQFVFDLDCRDEYVIDSTSVQEPHIGDADSDIQSNICRKQAHLIVDKINTFEDVVNSYTISNACLKDSVSNEAKTLFNQEYLNQFITQLDICTQQQQKTYDLISKSQYPMGLVAIESFYMSIIDNLQEIKKRIPKY